MIVTKFAVSLKYLTLSCIRHAGGMNTFKNRTSFPGCCSFIRVTCIQPKARAHPGEIAMPGPTSIQGTLIIKHAPAVRPVNSRVPCYFEYKNFQEIAEGRRETERERKGGKEKEKEVARANGFEILQGLPRQPSKRVTELSICMSERCRVFAARDANKYTKRARPITFRLPRVPYLLAPLLSSPLFSIYFMPSFSRRCRARFFQVTRFIRESCD